MTVVSPAGVILRSVSVAVWLAGAAAVGAGPAAAQSLTAGTDPAAQPAPSSLYFTITGRPAAPVTPAPRQPLGAEGDPGFYLGGVVGYAITGNLRAEIEAFYRHDGFDSVAADKPFDMTFTPSRPAPGSANVYGGMARGRWEFGNGSGFAPYIGGGVGLAAAEFDIIVDSVREHEEESLFAYEFTAGAHFSLTPRSSIRAGYRLFGTRDSERDPAKSADQTHSIELGIKYRF